MTTIRVVLADDQSLVRAGITALLTGANESRSNDANEGKSNGANEGENNGANRSEDRSRIEVAGEASDGVSAAALVRRIRPDVVLMDIRMPGGDGITATRAIRADPECRDVAILMLTTFDTDDEVLAAMRAGADGYLLKDTAPEPLRAAVRSAARGEPVLSPGVARQVMGHAAAVPQPVADPRLGRLTARELEVLAALADGDDNTAVARALSLSPDTVRTYVHRILGKLEAASRAQLVAIAHRSGLAAAHRRR
ncbi:response regulator transcription factor [Actinoplanes couchii]|uniref:DNA-binding response regulator n=1 Tax=Actinoplanes couchii TaxID=403638 RepID=A0ABQ3X5N8_9ACTN|nr:response regulator transcription factor [Actinoplanes couchii]MDR6325948.1 DNA-binding NarL/FixJ family response regulator [Actinoplanes couchii]GID53700.1 DNA-binding response regulator [Actinoplanes couchii]